MRHSPTGRSQFILRQTAFFCLLAFEAMGQAYSQTSPTALPTGGNTVVGAATINQNTTAMTVTQTTQRAIIDWNTYNIGKNASVQYVQPNANSSVLNRVANGSTDIAGRLTSNGHVFLINPNGVLFSPGAQVNVGSLVVGAGSISNASWLADKAYIENENKVINQGNISAIGSVVLAGKEVRNSGAINARAITLAAGDSVRLNLTDSGLIQAQVMGASAQALLDNSGLLQSDAGSIALTTSTSAGTAGGLITHSGIIRASAISRNGGVVSLTGGDVRIAGNIDVSSQSGDAGSVRIIADLSNGQLALNGSIDATGYGNGGMVETSAGHVKIGANSLVKTLSQAGKTGTWLIDPLDFTIGSGSTDDISGATLSTNLNFGSVTIQSVAGSLSGTGAIYVNNPITWSANTTLTLDAINNIEFQPKSLAATSNNNISASGDTAGLVFKYGAASDYRLNGNQVTMTGATPSLSLNGVAYTVMNARSTAILDSILRSNLNGNFALTSDINGAATAFANGGAGWQPLGSVTTPFSGQLHGFGHSINSVTINRPTEANVGLVAYNTGRIRDLGVDNATVTGLSAVGALVGVNAGQISFSHANNANVTAVGTGGRVGGLIGENRQTVEDSFSGGTVTGDANVGGLVGYNQQGELYNSYSTANVSGGARGGIGGLIGTFNNGLVFNSHYDVDTVTTNGEHILSFGGIYNAQYLDWIANNRRLNIANYSTTLPFDVTSGDYLVNSVQGMRDMLGFTGENRTFRLTSNLDLTSAPGLYIPILKGKFDGAGFKVSNLNLQIPKNSALGLVGWNYGSIINIGVDNANINGSYTLGALAAINIGNIDNSYSSGSIQGVGSVGGLVGANAGQIVNSNSSATVTASTVDPLDTKGGGLVGEHFDFAGISNSFSNGKVIAGGGLIGRVRGSGTGSVLDSYWDTQSSGQSTSAAGIGKTTAELSMQSTFPGWDFAKTWRIFEGTSAPTLRSFSRGAFDLVIRANDFNTVYGSGTVSAASLGVTATGLQGGDSLASLGTPLFGGSWINAINAGTYSIIPTGLSSPKYDIVFFNGQFTISKAPLFVTADNKNKVYGDLDPVLTSTVNGLKYSDTPAVLAGANLTSATGVNAVAGTHAINICNCVTPNYDVTYTPGVLTVSKAMLTVTADNKNKIYGDSDPVLTSTISGLKYTDTPNVLSGVTLATQTGATAIAGNFAITNSGGVANNYNVTNVPGVLTVDKAPLIVTADSKSKVYGDLDPLLTSTVSGLKYSDTSAVLTGVALSTVSGASAVAGQFAINNAGGTASNYSVFNVPGILTVSKAPLIITVDNKSKVYGDADPLLTSSIVGFKYSDTTAAISGFGLSTRTGAAATVGNQAITYSGTASNYDLTGLPGVLTVSKAPVTLISDNKSKVYGDAEPNLSTTVTGLKYADTSAVLSGVTLNTVAGASATVGNHAITNSGGVAQNYFVTSNVSGILNVVRAPLLVTADNKLMVFGTSIPALSYGVSGLKYTDAASVVTGVSLSTITTPTVGTHTIIAAGGVAQNYTITDVNGLLAVSAAPAQEEPIPIKSLDVVAVVAPLVVTAAAELTSTVNVSSPVVSTQRKLLFAPANNAINLDPTIGTLKDCDAANTGDCIATPRVIVEAKIDENLGDGAPALQIKRKIALVIGNNAYASPLTSLDGAVNDSGAIAKLLGEQGFEVNSLVDATRSQMIAGLNKLIMESRSDESITVFYAGHGHIHPGSSVGYWIPTDARIDDPRGWLSNIDIARFLSKIPARQVLLISDSCFSGSLTREAGAKDATTTLSRNAILGRRSVVAMSSGGEEVVADTAFDGHSPFTFFLLKELQQNKGEAYAKKILQNVREKVIEKASQVPSYGTIVSSGHVEGGEYLINPVKN